MNEELVGAAEIAKMLGVSRQRVFQLTSRPTFPAPVASLAMGKVWRASDVIGWANDSQREIRS